MKRLLLMLTATFALIAGCGFTAFGQASSTGSLNGVVTDPSEAVVPNATITVKNNDTGAEFSVQTTDNGTFTVPSLSAGTYTVTIIAQGFKQVIVQEVKINVGKPTSVNTVLELGDIRDTVTVTGHTRHKRLNCKFTRARRKFRSGSSAAHLLWTYLS